MNFLKRSLMFIVLLILLMGIGNAFAVDLNSTVELDTNDSAVISLDSSEIEVDNWEDIQYYASLDDKNYILKLRKNTNYYPTNVASTDSQIIFNNNVTIIGSEGAYIGDSSPNPRNITYTAMKVPDNSGIGITLKGVTFKWIATRYQPDSIFLQLGGNAVNHFEDCYFTDISTNFGHSSIVHIKLGDAVLSNCSFINCTTDYGCLSIYNPKDNPTRLCTLARMNVTDCYFEGNYARTAPGCINNAGKLVVINSTFYKNTAFWWAGAIHTTGGANTTLYDCRFLDNVAGWNGGALYTYSYLQIYNTTFSNNNCTTDNGGGAIGACKYQHAPHIYIQDCLFNDNENICWGSSELSSGTGRGGAISIMDEGSIEVRNTTFIKNSAAYGTAICAISAGVYGSPDVILVGNTFINHTRIGDVLDIRLDYGSYLEIRDNQYYNNSFEFNRLRLISDEMTGDESVIRIDCELKNPESFESDILDKAQYDIYVDGRYNKTVIGRTFTLNTHGKTCKVYAVPVMSNAPTGEILVGIPKEYVYVSQKSGTDANDGLTMQTPVATLLKALEIAKTKGNIVILDGTFNESGLTVDYSLNIAGEDGVRFTGSMPDTIFSVTNSSDLSITNVKFENIVFTTKNTGIIRQTLGFTAINNCSFSNNSYVSSGTNLIEARSIEIRNSIFTNHNNANVHMTLIRSNDFIIDSCIFSNNVASYVNYPSLIATSSEKSGVKGSISNSVFKSNTVKYGCIYFGANLASLTVTNTQFIANSVGSASDHSSCIRIENSPTVKIDSSIFIDNVDLGSRSALIYVSGDYASVSVSNSIILNNSYENTNGMVFSSSASNMNAYKNLDGNWWGNTCKNYTSAPAVSPSACSNWVVLNTTVNATVLAIGQKALVYFDLFNVADRQGNLSFYDASKLPKIVFDISAVNGSVSSSKVNVINGYGTVEYTLESLNGGLISASYENVKSMLNFDWAGLEIAVNVKDITYGDDLKISFDFPDDIDESKLVLRINGDYYYFNKTMLISNLMSGEYLINLTYPGDSKYDLTSFTKQFSVEKASPNISVNVNDTYYGNPLKIMVSTNLDVNEDISIEIGIIKDSKAISNGKAEFSIDCLEANAYEIFISYPGNENYTSKNLTSRVNVKKYESTLKVSVGNVEMGKDIDLTFEVNHDASGIITVYINGKMENISLSGGFATYTIRNISKGLHNIEARYNGDAKYLESRNTTEIDIGRISADLNVVVENITYGQDAVFTITLNNDASGSVSIIIDGKNYSVTVANGKANLNISDLTAGCKIASIQYSGDNTYLPIHATKEFSIEKVKPTLTIDVYDIKDGQVANVKITISRGATGTLEIITPNESESPQIPRTGLISRTIFNLNVGQYEISADYAGDDNYLCANASKTFSVFEWSNPQWPNEGFDVKNTERSPYESDANGGIIWISDIDSKITGNMAIDSDGKIYITTSDGIYSLEGSDGSIIWIFKSNEAGENFSGIAISRDMILSPKSGHKLFFINQTTGEILNNNIFQGSSIFTPVVDENANIYISSEYQTATSSYNLVIVPYEIWEFSTTPVLINIGQSAPTAAPVLINNNTAVIATEDSLKIIDFQNRQVTNSFNVITHVRPVISDNIIYTIVENAIVSITPGGSIWKVNINGTAGNHLSVGQNGEIFAVTKEGVLYEYSTGEEVLIYDFRSQVDQALLVGGDDKLYVGSANGDFYAIDIDGNLLWKISLNEGLSGIPVMDSNGTIYVISGNRVAAIGSGVLRDSNLSASIKNISYNDDLIVNVEVDGEATGTVSLNIANAYINESTIENGQASFVIPNLNVDNYTASITYSGDGKFNSQSIDVSFIVSKAIPTINVEYGNVVVGNDLNVDVTDLPWDATGNASFNINAMQFIQKILNGAASFNIEGLPAGDYGFSVTYHGDSNYNNITCYGNVRVLKTIISEDMTRAYNSGVDFKATLFNLSGEGLSNADVEVMVDKSKSTLKTDDRGVLVLNSKLAVGSHLISITNPATGEIASNTVVIVKRLTDNANLVMDYSDGSKFKVRVYGDDGHVAGANEIVVMKVAGKTYYVKTDKNGWASLGISLIPKTYAITSEYKGFKVSNKITVKSVIKAKNLSKKKSKTIKYSITLKNSKNKPLKSKKVTFKFRGKTYKAKTNKKGIATVNLKNIKVGKFSIKITYLKHTVTKRITIKK